MATGEIDITLNNVVHKLNDSATKYGVYVSASERVRGDEEWVFCALDAI